MISVIAAYFRTARVQIAALCYFLFAGLATQLPLFNYLGYEFSALLTIPAALISGTLTILFYREHKTKPLTRRTWLFVICDYYIVNFILLLIPFTVIALNAFAVKNCAMMKGVVLFLLLPVMTMVFSVSLGMLVGTVVKRSLLFFWAIVALFLLQIVFITYFQPQLFAYNFILGYFPGITYDETSSSITQLVLFRQFTLVAALMMIVLSILLLRWYDSSRRIVENTRKIVKGMREDTPLWIIAIVCLAVVILGHIYRSDLGFEYSADTIRNDLGRRTESKHFIIYYSSQNYSRDEILRIKSESEYHYRKIADALRYHSDLKKRIEVYIYPTSEWKQKYIGTANTNIAKPWKQEIHLTASTYASTFRHELVHSMAADFGFPVIKASTRMGLNEGLAVALDWDEGLFTAHQYAAAIDRDIGLSNVEGLFSYSGFAAQSSSYAYLVSGSFCRYLIDRYGIERFLGVFPNGNFMRTFGESLLNLTKDWRAYLKTIDISQLPPETVKSVFSQQSIFYKTCAREVADQNQRALTELRLKNYEAAENTFRESYANAPTASALRGYFQSLNSQQKSNEVLRTYSELPAQSLLRSNPSIMLLLADAFYLNGKYTEAHKYYQSLRRMNVSDYFIELSSLRLQCLADSIDSSLLFMLTYGGSADTVKHRVVQKMLLQKPGSIALGYIQAVQMPDTLSLKEQLFISLIPAVKSSDIKYYTLLRAAHHNYGMNEYENAKTLYWQANNYLPIPAMSEYLEERIEMCEFISMDL